MPRLKGKYDGLLTYPHWFRFERNFYEPIEDIARKNPAFANRLTQIRKETEMKEWQERQKGATIQKLQQIKNQGDQKLWEEIMTALRKRRMH